MLWRPEAGRGPLLRHARRRRGGFALRPGAHTCWARQRLSPPVKRARLFLWRHARRPSRGACGCHDAISSGAAARVAFRRRCGGAPCRCPGACFGGPDSATRRLRGALASPLRRRALPAGPRRDLVPVRARRRRRGGLRCAPPPWRRYAPLLSWRSSVGPDSPPSRGRWDALASSPRRRALPAEPRTAACSAAAWRHASCSAAVAAVRSVAIPAPISVGPAAPLAVGGARSPLALCDARRQPSRVGCHDALGSGVAVCVAPLRRGGSAPRRRPGDWHPSGGLLTVGGAQTVAPKA